MLSYGSIISCESSVCKRSLKLIPAASFAFRIALALTIFGQSDEKMHLFAALSPFAIKKHASSSKFFLLSKSCVVCSIRKYEQQLQNIVHQILHYFNYNSHLSLLSII